MPQFVTGVVTEILSERRGLQKIRVRRADDGPGERAYVLTELIGAVDIGDRVVLNVTAVELSLGTGGWHFVHWNLARETFAVPGPGHIMKLRYTSLQVDTGAIEDAADYRENADLDGLPVVICPLHSQIAAVAAACKAVEPDVRIAYVMTDQAALAFALSDLVEDLQRAGLVDSTISVGQAFGAQREAINLASALAVAKSVDHADIVVVADGPGIIGTGTSLGFGALHQAAAVNVANHLGGQPIVTLRWSDVDGRERHRGISHHSRTLLEFAGQAVVAVPRHYQDHQALHDLSAHDLSADSRPADSRPADSRPADSRPADSRPALTFVAIPNVGELFASHDLVVKTMGRSVHDDPAFFAFAAAAGVAAALALPKTARSLTGLDVE